MTQRVDDRLTATLLIVDDEPNNIRILADTFVDQYHIAIAKSGQEVLDYVDNYPSPDLILLDIMMPGMSGYDVCRNLKINNKTRDVPIIFVTAMNSNEDEKTGLDLGAVDYISKPFHIPIIEARVHTHIKLKQATDLLKHLLQEKTIAIEETQQKYQQLFQSRSGGYL